MIIAAIDVGTNTALLLVAEVSPDGMRPLYEEQRFVRLGEGVDATSRIKDSAMLRLKEALLAYKEKAQKWNAEEIIVGATSASRDALNRTELIDFVRRETGLDYEVLPGEDEALWSFLGATSVSGEPGEKCLVLDIGGGSTEIVIGQRAVAGMKAIHFRKSLNIGTVRLTERLFSSQPPSKEEIETAVSVLERAFLEAEIPVRDDLAFIGAAGTASSLALVHAGVASWAALHGHPQVINYAEVHQWRQRLLAADFDEVLTLNPAVLAGRADVFPTGVLILDVFMRTFRLTRCTVSPRGLRHGLAIRYAMHMPQDLR